MIVNNISIRCTRSKAMPDGSTVEASTTVNATLEPESDVTKSLEDLFDRVDDVLRRYLTLSPPAAARPTAKPQPAAKRVTSEQITPSTRAAVSKAPASEKQIRCIHGRARDAGVDIRTWLQANYGTEHLHDLTMSEASQVIDQLQVEIEGGQTSVTD